MPAFPRAQIAPVSLSLSAVRQPGGGACGLCLPPAAGQINTNDLVSAGRVARDGVAASCGTLKNVPGSGGGNRHFDLYATTNTIGADACVTIQLTAPTCDVEAVAYLGNFDPTRVEDNYLGDAGLGTADFANGVSSFSATVPAGATLLITVTEVNADTGCSNYVLNLSGLPCPQPVLNIAPLAYSQTRLSWPTAAGGYALETTLSLFPATWAAVTNEPTVNSGFYNVTNGTANPNNQFYRLHKK